MPITINWQNDLKVSFFNIVEMTKKLTFDEVVLVIQSDNSAKLNELINEKRIVDMNMRDLQRTKTLLMATRVPEVRGLKIPSGLSVRTRRTVRTDCRTTHKWLV